MSRTQAAIWAGERLLKVKKARERLFDFMHLMLPDEVEPDDPNLSEYQDTRHGRLLCDVVEKVESGRMHRVAVAIPPQHGKPVAETALVLMGDGSRKPLRDLVVGDSVITHRGRPRAVQAIYTQGDLPCLRVTTTSGREVVATPDHPFLTPGGWRKLGDLEPGDYLANVRAPVIEGPASTEQDRCTARLLGYFVGDGCTTQNGATISASITCVDPAQTEDIIHCGEVLGFVAKSSPPNARASGVAFSGGVRPFLRLHALAGKNSHEKRVPGWVFTAGQDAIAAFVGAYFACDGTIGKKGVDRHGIGRKDICLEFYSVSRGLLDDVQHLLLRLGVQSRIAVKKGRYKGEVHLSYRLSITSQQDAAVFINKVPVYGRKAAILAGWGVRETDFPAPLLPDRIVAVEEAGDVACRCISVEEDRSFTADDLVAHNTWHLSTYGLAWILGRNPRARIIVATYNETRAEELGEELRRVVQSPQFRQIFPGFELATGSQSKTSMSSTKNGRIFFVGVGGTITGRTAHYFFIDDPIKGDEDAQSALYREKLWSWFFSVAYSRGGNKTPIVVIHTRWHHDDLIGRLCDPDHPERDKRYAGVAEDWKFLNIPGVVTDPDLAHALKLTLAVPTDPKVTQAFGSKPMSSLWPESKGLEHYAQWKRAEPRTFSALVMGNPSAEEGDYFKAEWIVEYDESDLPPLSELQIYGASDHAVSLKQDRDYTVLGCVGVDKNDDIWVLPSLVWARMQTPQTVEEIILNMKANSPFYWWMESELISKSFGPFLIKRMEEEGVYVPIDEVTVSKDKMLRARAIQGRMSMKKVRFPRSASWFADGKAQLLKFPFGAHDDFVDWLAHIGLGLLKQHKPSTSVHKNGNNVVQVGSISWILQRTKLEEEAKRKGARKAAGW